MRFNISNPIICVRNVRSENFKTLGAVMEKLDSDFVMTYFSAEYEDFVEK